MSAFKKYKWRMLITFHFMLSLMFVNVKYSIKRTANNQKSTSGMNFMH